MFKAIKIALIFIIFLSSGGNLWAAIDSSLLDKSIVKERIPEDNIRDNYKNKRDFRYTDTVEAGPGPLTRFFRYLSEKLGLNKVGNPSNSAEMVKWVAIIVAIFGLGLWLFRAELSGAFTRGGEGMLRNLKTQYLDLSVSTETLRSLLEKAIAEKNYKEAVRLYYSLSLKELSESSLIFFRAEKTNHEYVIELGSADIREPFKKLTYYFEHVFYGDFEATENVFINTGKAFNELDVLVKRKGVAR